MLCVFSDLMSLYESNGIPVSPKYVDVCRAKLRDGLAYSTAAMYGITGTILSSPILFAHNLVQNAIDEAKGAARVKIMAERYSDSVLGAFMDRHVSDEFKHSVQFRKLLKHTGFSENLRPPMAISSDIEKVLDFDDNLKQFICRVHSIEIRSWTVLRTYIDILSKSDVDKFKLAIPVLEDIMADEITHVIYTGRQLSDWITEDGVLASTLADCFNHTNHETWRDMVNMAEYFADHHDEIWPQNDPEDIPMLETA